MQVYVENVSYLICLKASDAGENLGARRAVTDSNDLNNRHITLREVDKKTARASAGPFRNLFDKICIRNL